MKDLSITTQTTEPGVYVIRYLLSGTRARVGRCLRILNISDVHIDSLDSDRELLAKHLQQADVVKIFGDLFDLMQSKNDKRRNYGELKEKYKVGNYIDAVVEDAVQFFKPFAHKIVFVSVGNHETAIINHLGTNPISIFCSRLRSLGSPVIEGSYQGFQIDLISRFKTKATIARIVNAYHHGHGTNAQKTEGALEIEGDKAKFPNADFVLKGDNHYKWHNPGQNSYWITDRFKLIQRVQHHIRLGTYKKPQFANGWAVEKGFKPTPIGGWFVDHYVGTKHNNSKQTQYMSYFEVVEAK